MKPALFALDVDGVLTTGQMIYSREGKMYKIFGPDDHDALNLLRDQLPIVFLTADQRGFDISYQRVVKEMNFPLELLSPDQRLAWLKAKAPLDQVIYMGDGLFDIEVFSKVGYSICPQNGYDQGKKQADHVTRHSGGDRAVAEAVVHILKKFYKQTRIAFSAKQSVWKNKGEQ